MVICERTAGPTGAVEIEIPYTVTGALDLRDNQGVPFEPATAQVRFRDGRPWWVRVRGRRRNEGRTWTTGGFGVGPDGTIETDQRNPQAPPFVRLLIDEASQHPAVLACVAYARAGSEQ